VRFFVRPAIIFVLLVVTARWASSATSGVPISSVQIYIELQSGASAIVQERYSDVRGSAFDKFQCLTDSSAQIQDISISQNGADLDFSTSAIGPWAFFTLKTPVGMNFSSSEYIIQYRMQLYDQDSNIPIVMPTHPITSDQEWGTKATIHLHLPDEYGRGEVRLPQMERMGTPTDLIGNFPALPSIVRFRFPSGAHFADGHRKSNSEVTSFLGTQFYTFLLLQVLWVIFYFVWARVSAGGRL